MKKFKCCYGCMEYISNDVDSSDGKCMASGRTVRWLDICKDYVKDVEKYKF